MKGAAGSFKFKLVAYFVLLSLLPLAAAYWGFTTVAARAETRTVDARLQAGLRATLAAYQQSLRAADAGGVGRCHVNDAHRVMGARADAAQRSRSGLRPGPILDGDGREVGEHAGLARYTVGQRRGLGRSTAKVSSGRPLYVLALEPETGELVRGAVLSSVSADRIEAELRKLAAEPGARAGFELLAEWGLLDLSEDAGDLIDRAAALLGREPWSALAPRPDVILAGPGLRLSIVAASSAVQYR